jgi:hypothetical protein
MDLQAALLCRSATVSDGRLSVLEAGITHFYAGEFPLALDASLAIVVNADPEEQDRPHHFCACVHDADRGDHAIARVTGEFLALRPSDADRERINVPMAFDLRPIGIPEPGAYRLEVCIDDEVLATLEFRAGFRAH